MVKESTVNSITFNELKVLIKKRYEDVEEEKIEEIIATLIEKEYLLTELRIPSYCNDSVQHVINVLKDKTSEKELVNKLENLQNLMLAYSNQRAVCQDNVDSLRLIYWKRQRTFRKKDRFLLLQTEKSIVILMSIENTHFFFPKAGSFRFEQPARCFILSKRTKMV